MPARKSASILPGRAVPDEGPGQCWGVLREADVRAAAPSREAHFRALLEAAPDGMVVANTQGTIELVNAQTERLFGYSRDQLIGQPIEVLVPERLRKSHVGNRDAFIREPRVRPMGVGQELYGCRADGSVFPVEISLSPVETEQGSLIIAAVRDVTRARQTEKALRDRETRFRALLEAAPDGVVIANTQGTIELVNAQTERLFGYSRDQLIGQPIEILVPERLREGHVGYRDAFIREPRVRSMGEGQALYGRRADGSEFPVEISLSPVQTEQGTLIIAAVRDVTRARQAEKTLRDRETRFRALLESSPDGVVIANTQGTIELVNAQTERLFGYSRDQLIGQPIEILVPERLREGHVGYRDTFIREPRVRPMGVGQELHGRCADGSAFPVEISLSPVQTEQGTLIIAAVRDVTEHQRIRHEIEELNQRLTRDNTELTAVNRELEAFSYSVSHDLRAPLRAIDGFSQALMEDCFGQLDDHGRDYLKRVRRAAQRMGRLIDDLLMLSRVTRSEMRPRAVDLSTIAQGIAEDLKGREPDRLADFAIADTLSAQGDARLLRIVLENLLGNAWKFTAGRNPGRIEFGRREVGGVAAFFVRDNGAGFDAAYADRLFQPFQRLHDDKSFPGTGIGLATVQRILRRHGGTIWAESTPDKGATFYFTL